MAQLKDSIVQGSLRVTDTTTTTNLVITNTTAPTIATSDYLILADASDSNKILKGPAFNTSNTTKWLTQAGTWTTPTAANVGALASGTVVNKVKQSSNTTSAAYKVLLSTTASPSSGSDYETYYGSLTYNPSTKALVTGGTVDGLTLASQTTGFKISGGTTSKTLTVGADYTLGAACTYSVDDATSNGALSNGTGLTTERSVYYGLVTVNNASQTRATGIYAPTSAGTANQILVSAGGTLAPTWKATANGAAYATSENGELTFGILPVAQGGIGTITPNKNTVFAGSATTDGQAPEFRALTAADIPVLDLPLVATYTISENAWKQFIEQSDNKLPFSGHVHLRVYNSSSTAVSQQIDLQFMSRNNHIVMWGRDSTRSTWSAASSGVYQVRGYATKEDGNNSTYTNYKGGIDLLTYTTNARTIEVYALELKNCTIKSSLVTTTYNSTYHNLVGAYSTMQNAQWGLSIQNASQASYSYGSNDGNSYRTNGSTLPLAGYGLFGIDEEGKTQGISIRTSGQTASSSDISTTRIYNTHGIDWTKGIFYTNTSTWYAVNANVNIAQCTRYYIADLRYSDNCVSNSSASTTLGMIPRKPVYLRGYIKEDNLFYLAPIEVVYNSSTYKRAWTQDVPTSEESITVSNVSYPIVYMYLGFPYYDNAYSNYRLSLTETNPIYYYKDGYFKRYLFSSLPVSEGGTGNNTYGERSALLYLDTNGTTPIFKDSNATISNWTFTENNEDKYLTYLNVPGKIRVYNSHSDDSELSVESHNTKLTLLSTGTPTSETNHFQYGTFIRSNVYNVPRTNGDDEIDTSVPATFPRYLIYHDQLAPDTVYINFPSYFDGTDDLGDPCIKMVGSSSTDFATTINGTVSIGKSLSVGTTLTTTSDGTIGGNLGVTGNLSVTGYLSSDLYFGNNSSKYYVNTSGVAAFNTIKIKGNFIDYNINATAWTQLRWYTETGGSSSTDYQTTAQTNPWVIMSVQTPAKRTSDSYYYNPRVYFTIMSRSGASSLTQSGYYVRYFLPDISTGLSANKEHTIITTNNLYQVKDYTYSYTLSNGSTTYITATNLGVSTPSGYTPVAVCTFNAGSNNCTVTAVWPTATGSGNMMRIRNLKTGSGSETNTAAISILYLKTAT